MYIVLVQIHRVDWAGHEKHLLDHYLTKCADRPFHAKSFQTLRGTTPVSFLPRTVTLLSGFQPEGFQPVTVNNHSTSHSVRYLIKPESLPAWMAVSEAEREGVIPPGGAVTVTVTCQSDAADARYVLFVCCLLLCCTMVQWCTVCYI